MVYYVEDYRDVIYWGTFVLTVHLALQCTNRFVKKWAHEPNPNWWIWILIQTIASLINIDNPMFYESTWCYGLYVLGTFSGGMLQSDEFFKNRRVFPAWRFIFEICVLLAYFSFLVWSLASRLTA